VPMYVRAPFFEGPACIGIYQLEFAWISSLPRWVNCAHPQDAAVVSIVLSSTTRSSRSRAEASLARRAMLNLQMGGFAPQHSIAPASWYATQMLRPVDVHMMRSSDVHFKKYLEFGVLLGLDSG
jgi:hypothetical protein